VHSIHTSNALSSLNWAAKLLRLPPTACTRRLRAAVWPTTKAETSSRNVRRRNGQCRNVPVLKRSALRRWRPNVRAFAASGIPTHSFWTRCRLLHEPLVPTHQTASNKRWRRPCFLEWASCSRSQNLWGTFWREGGYSKVYSINTFSVTSSINSFKNNLDSVGLMRKLNTAGRPNSLDPETPV